MLTPAVIALAAVAFAAGDAASVREAVVRKALGHTKESAFFRAYCVAMSQEAREPIADLSKRFGFANGAPDAAPDFLRRFANLPHRLMPQSACKKTTDDYDVVEASTGRGPALLMLFGAIEVFSPSRVRLLGFTTSGSLTETWTEYEVERRADGTWEVVRDAIILQA